MNPTISVIMPMYNAEKYIRLMLESVLDQEFSDFELILIDDASTDRTLEIAKSFNDPRITVIENKENLGGANGPGVVRNVGLDAAKGDYIYFMDNDDVLMPDGLKILLTAAVHTNADVVIGTKNFVPLHSDFTKLAEIPDIYVQDRGKMNPIADDSKKRITE